MNKNHSLVLVITTIVLTSFSAQAHIMPPPNELERMKKENPEAYEAGMERMREQNKHNMYMDPDLAVNAFIKMFVMHLEKMGFSTELAQKWAPIFMMDIQQSKITSLLMNPDLADTPTPDFDSQMKKFQRLLAIANGKSMAEVNNLYPKDEPTAKETMDKRELLEAQGKSKEEIDAEAPLPKADLEELSLYRTQLLLSGNSQAEVDQLAPLPHSFHADRLVERVKMKLAGKSDQEIDKAAPEPHHNPYDCELARQILRSQGISEELLDEHLYSVTSKLQDMKIQRMLLVQSGKSLEEINKLVPMLSAYYIEFYANAQKAAAQGLVLFRDAIAKVHLYVKDQYAYFMKYGNEDEKANAPGGTGSFAPPQGWRRELPRIGNPKILVLLADFTDYPATAQGVTRDEIDQAMFGSGSLVTSFPYEGYKNYYSRASYNLLNLQGTVVDYYNHTGARSTISTNLQLINLIMTNKDSSVDFSQFDNDGNGYIDLTIILWTGPDNGWSNFWWAYQTSAYSNVFDGVRTKTIVWQWVNNPSFGDPAGAFAPKVVIHETGHGLGLPDYYDYDDSVGPKGGIGGLDMMASNKGDHNGFSKWVLDWHVPTFHTSGSLVHTMQAAGTSNANSVIAKVGFDASQIFSEYFLTQNRFRVATGNDKSMPGDGLLIWHVDSTLNSTGTNYKYDNSYTARKLLRLSQADGLEQIESGGNANADDYYVSGKELTAASTPNSNFYDTATPINGRSAPSGIGVQSISGNAQSMTALFTAGEPSGVKLAASAYTVDEAAGTVTVTVQRTGSTDAFTVDYATSNGTAISGTDYTSTSGTLSFGANENSKTVTIPIIDNAIIHIPDRWFNFTLSNSSVLTIPVSNPYTAKITIADNDAALFALSTTTYSVWENQGPLTVTVTRNQNTGNTDTVVVSTSPSTATPGVDYTSVTQTLTFTPGMTSQTVTLPIIDDSTREEDELFTVSLSSPSSLAKISNPSSALCVIYDDDRPMVEMTAPIVGYHENQKKAHVTIRRMNLVGGETQQAAGFALRMWDGTAQNGPDYTGKTGKVLLLPGMMSVDVEIPLVDDGTGEGTETFNVRIDAGYNVRVGPNGQSTVQIND